MKYTPRVSILIALMFLVPGIASAVAIDPSNDTAAFENSDYGSLHWTTTNGTAVNVTATALTGNVWGDSVGWITLNPTNSGVTNSCSGGVGTLGGYAWGENTGWINFAPTNGGVTINSSGEFNGNAWSQNYGWIDFTCPSATECVKAVSGVCSGESGSESSSSETTNLRARVGSSGGGVSGGTGFSNANNKDVLGKEGDGLCEPYLTSYIREGGDNDPAQVRKLEQFLIEKEGETALRVDGIYGPEDIAAVKRFQSKYASAVLNIWGLTEPTGYVYRTTLLKINSFYCGGIQCPAFTEFNEYQKTNTNSAEIEMTKRLLHDLGFFNGTTDQNFDADLFNALVTFQETFRETMLNPWGLSGGTGYKYKTTNKFLNFLVGCDTGEVELEGIGTFNY